MVPLWKHVGATFTQGLITQEAGELTDFFLDFDTSTVRQLQDDVTQASERAVKEFNGGLITRDEGRHWEIFGGTIDMATTVNDLAWAGDRVFAATGHVYGNVYTCGLDPLREGRIYLPLVYRE